MKQSFSLLLLYYFRLLAKLQLLKNSKAITIGVTGSAGKSSTIEAVAAALKSKYKVKTTALANSESGIPLAILGLKPNDYSPLDWLRLCLLAPFKLAANWEKFDVLLVEMGIDAPTPPKNMSYLLSIVKPDIGIFLNVSPVHLFNFKNLDQIAKEKSKLANTAKSAIVNLSDPLVKKYTTNKSVTPIVPITIPAFKLPKIYSVSFGAAVATAKILKIDQKTAVQNIQKYFRLPPSRCSIFKGINDTTIIDSSYNYSPLAGQEMLNFLKTFLHPRIAILGDMRELGSSTAASHRQIYQSALNTADTIISVGPETQKYFGPRSKKFLYWWQASEFLHKNLPQKSTILIKGSQNTIFLEELVKSLLKNPSNAKLLCRQTKYWLSVKNKFHHQHSTF